MHSDLNPHARPLSEVIGGSLNPEFVEWLMGYPIGATELSVLATAWFRSVRVKRLKGSRASGEDK